MIPGVIGVGLYTGMIAYIENDLLQAKFKNTTAIHSLVGFVLSLLLVFRTNTAYERWSEGRRIWGNITNDSRNFFMKYNALVSNPDLRAKALDLINNFNLALKNRLRDKKGYEDLNNLDDSQKERYANVDHLPITILNDLNMLVYENKINNELNDRNILFIKDELKGFADHLGACERIKNTPIPYSYNMFIKKVIFIYVFTMPIGFVREFGYWAMPIVSIIFYVFASIELIAEEIEDPFGDDENDLPLDQICENIAKNLSEIYLSKNA
jgi:putative membrane protein